MVNISFLVMPDLIVMIVAHWGLFVRLPSRERLGLFTGLNPDGGLLVLSPRVLVEETLV